MSESIFDRCPAYETPGFTLRLVRPEDAEDLLGCYADPRARRLMNSDNCDYGFAYDTLEGMRACVESWLREYEERRFVRLSVVEKGTGRAVGTLEAFDKRDLGDGARRYGILRLDLASQAEREELILQLLELAGRELSAAVGVTHWLTKAIPEAEQRVAALKKAGYTPAPDGSLLPYGDYWMSQAL